MQVNPFPSNPFVGLRPFESTESIFFFGRGAQTGELLERLYTCRFVSVVGRSGCGKSSLIRAGLIPKLKAGFLVADRDRWIVETMKPGDHPLHNLAAAVLRVSAGEPAPEAAAARAAEVDALVEEISASGVEAVAERLAPVLDAGDANFLLLVDQFEEIFRFGARARKDDEGEEEDAADARSRDEAADFVAIMLALSEQRDVPAYVVMTMRSDFLGDCDAFHGLPAAMNRSQYLVPRLSTQQREEAISGPIRLYGQSITPRLLDLVRNDVGDQLDQLPVMQHAMMRTWENWSAHGGRPIDLPDYHEAGTIRGALSDDAEQVLASMGDPGSGQRRLTERVFQALTDTDSENRRIRRPVHLGRLEAITGARRDELMEIVSLFQGGGRSFLTISRDEARGNHLIDISHESLIRQWKTLRDWVDKEAEDRSLYVRVVDAALRRKESGGKRGGLWDDPELQQALDWWGQRAPTVAWAAQYHRKSKQQKMPPADAAPAHDEAAYDDEDIYIYTEARNFLEESRRARDQERADKETQRKRELKLTRLITLVVFAGLLLSSGLGAYAVVQKRRANEQTVIAREQTVIARAAEKTAQGRAIQERETRIVKENLLAAERGKLAALQNAAENARKAEEAKDEALKQQRLAEDNAKSADAAKTRAVAEAERAVAAERSAKDGEERNARLIYAADITFAEHALQEGERERGQQRLRRYYEGDAAVRSFEWCYLWRRYRRDLAAFDGRQGKLQSVAASPDGRALATAGTDHTLKLWDTATREARTLSGHAESILSVAYSPDRKLIATGGADKTVKLWEAASGREVRTLPLAAEVYALAFSPSGQWLAAGDSSGEVTVWDMTAPSAAPRKVKAHDAGVNTIAFSTFRSSSFATGSSDKTVSLWDAPTLTKTATATYGKEVTSVAFAVIDHSPKLFTVAGTIYVTSVGLADVPGAGGPRQLVGETMSLGGSFVAVGDTDGDTEEDMLAVGNGNSIRLMRLEDVKDFILTQSGSTDREKEQAALTVLEPVDAENFLTAGFMPGRPALVTGDTGGVARLWDIKSEKERASETGLSGRGVLGVAFAAGDALAASINRDGSFSLWDIDGLKKVADLPRQSGQRLMAAFDFSPTEKILARGDGDGTVALWRVEGSSATPLRPLPGGTEKFKVNVVAFSRGGAMLAVADDNGRVRVWADVASNEPRLLKTFAAFASTPVTALAFSAGADVLAVGAFGGSVVVWDTQSWAVKEHGYLAPSGEPIAKLSFSGDGKGRNLLVVSGGRLQTWDTSREQSEEVTTLGQPGTPSWRKVWPSVVTLEAEKIIAAVFSHDGRTIATSDQEGKVRLWDALARDEESSPSGQKRLVTRLELATVKKGGDRPTPIILFSLAFSSDDRMLLGGDGRGFVWLWRGVTEDDLAAQQGRPAAVANH
jgi:WD40 repeat protein